MTDAQNEVEATVPTAASPKPPAVGGPANRVTGYALVAIVALAVGVAATVGVLRWQGEWRSKAAEHASAHPDQSTPASSMHGDDIGGVYISPARQQLIGVRTAAVERKALARSIRTVGTLAYDETRVVQVHTRIAGWIDRLFVDFAGKPVERGEPLFTIYSPDLVATENEYLLARKAQAQLVSSRFQETRESAASLLGAARKRLQLWDISEEQIAEIERTGEPKKTLTLYAPASGVVLERNAFPGQYVTPDVTTFKLADVSTVWAIGQVVEADLAHVRLGQTVAIELPNTPGSRPVSGRIGFIYPDIDPATRRGRVRVDIPNPSMALRPDTFVTISINEGAAPALAVPAEAVIDTGTTQYVILARGDGFFEPRPIHVGPPTSNYYPVTSGLAEGDRVVTSAQFLVDSETNLQAAMQAMSDMPGMGALEDGGGVHDHGAGSAGGDGAHGHD